MDWGRVWRTLFCGWDADTDVAALARGLADFGERPATVDDHDAGAWVCRQIQESY